jgi:CheY-like chemotaxis protein
MAASTVLVIEDNFIQREGLATALREQGFTVLTAEDGNDALNRLSNGPVPDLVLLDMLTPRGDGDGWWFLQQRKRIRTLASIPVLITTAIPVASREWAASLGSAGLLRKPFEVELLLAEIRHLEGTGRG